MGGRTAWWLAVFPPAQWLPAYRAEWIRGDAIAGVTLAAYAIPVSLAYATLAGLPPHHGIFCYLLGGLFYALFGTSRQLAIGPTSAISLLVGTTVAGMAGDDPERWAAIAAASYGLQAGVQSFAYSMFFMTDSALEYLQKGAGFEIGVGPSIVVVDAGMAKPSQPRPPRTTSMHSSSARKD